MSTANIYEIEFTNDNYGDEIYDADRMVIEDTYRAGASLFYLVTSDMELAQVESIVTTFEGFVTIRAMN